MLKSDQISLLSSLLHDVWQSSRKQKYGSFKPQFKKTTDEQWIKKNNTQEFDAANTSFEELPSDLKVESLASAEVALNEIYLAKENNEELDDEFVEKASAILHEKWLDRHDEWTPDEQKLPYAELSEEEKEKDRVIIRKGLEIFNQK